MSKRNTFSPKFKHDAVMLVINGSSIIDIATKKGIGKSTLNKWVSEYKKSGKIDIESQQVESRSTNNDASIIKKLKAKVSELQSENKTLMKTISILSKNV